MSKVMSFDEFKQSSIEDEIEVVDCVSEQQEVIDAIEPEPEQESLIQFETRSGDTIVMASPFPVESPAYFPVEARPLLIQIGDQYIEEPERKAIVRTDTNKLLGVHKKSYKLVSNQVVYPQFEEALIRSNLDLTGVYVKDKVSMHGAKTVRDYFFPGHTVQIGSNNRNDEVEMRFRVVNSYDGTYCFGYMLGAYRLICENGLVIGHELNSQFVRHTQNLNEAHLIRNFETSVSIFVQHGEVWNQWLGHDITDSDVHSALDSFPKINDRLKKTMIEYWDVEKQKQGSNVWALFNALTFWSSHHKIKNSKNAGNNQGDVILARESRVEEFLHTRAFQALAS